jgi:transcriptional regulator with XRE-family HTH domain
MHIGKRIQILMDQRRVSRAQLAEHCSITTGAVSNWFSTGRISKDNLAKVAQLLQVDMSRLIMGDVIATAGDAFSERRADILNDVRDLISRYDNEDDLRRVKAKINHMLDEDWREFSQRRPVDAEQTPVVAPMQHTLAHR